MSRRPNWHGMFQDGEEELLNRQLLEKIKAIAMPVDLLSVPIVLQYEAAKYLLSRSMPETVKLQHSGDPDSPVIFNVEGMLGNTHKAAETGNQSPVE